MANAIRVEGLGELIVAFGLADKELRNDLRDALAESAAPVRSDAQSLAGSGAIRNLHGGDPWTGMRIGVLSAVAYVAPVERGAKGRGNARRRRPAFADLLLGRAMEPALERNTANVERRFEEMLDDVFRVWQAV